MTSRSLARRLDRLEERMVPIDEPSSILKIVYVNSAGTEVPGGYQIEIPSYGRAQNNRRAANVPQPWRRNRPR
jgi:hypothetical protein